MQKPERIEYRMRHLPKRLEQRRERGLGGARAFGMSAHAVDDGQQHGLFVGGDCDPVLVFLAVADQAHIRGFDLQWLLHVLLLNSASKIYRRPLRVASQQVCRKPSMIRSMTGFARRERQFPWGMLAWELKTVNHRFLEIGCRLPEEFRASESDFRASVAASVRRGKVDCSLFYRPTIATTSLEVDAQVLDALTQRAPASGDVVGRPGAHRRSGPAQVARSRTRRPRATCGLSWKPRMPCSPRRLPSSRAFAAARARACRTRSSSGAMACSNSPRAWPSACPKFATRIRAKLRDRIAQLVSEVDHDRVEQELAILAQRLDVDEEIDRLRGHVAEVRKAFAAEDAAGRRLDFLMQELNREANTLSSKSQDLETTRAAVDMKVLIEQMREQVQNIE